MISTEEEEILRIFYFVCKQKADCLKALFSTVHIIAKKQIIGLRWESSIFKKSQKITILTMNVTCNQVRRKRESQWYTWKPDTSDIQKNFSYPHSLPPSQENPPPPKKRKRSIRYPVTENSSCQEFEHGPDNASISTNHLNTSLSVHIFSFYSTGLEQEKMAH